VSFAPEATLHTWNVVELNEDSTSSSAANSTRRASSLANSTNQAPPEPLETSTEDPDAAFSPVKLGEQPRELSSSPFSGSSAGGSDGTQSPVKEVDVDDTDSDSEDFDGESTAMSLDDVTARTNATGQVDDSTSSSVRLNEALRQAAQEAGTAGIDDEDDDEVSMEIADQEITGAFKPWIQKGQRISFDTEDMSALQDQENVNSFQPPDRHEYSDTADDAEDDYNENEELSMEITNAVGKILGGAPNRQSLGHRKSIGEQTNYDEQTMELTKVVGGIEAQQSPAKSDVDSNMNDDEEMTMEFTSVVGGVLSKPAPAISRPNDNFEPQRSEQAGRDFSEWGDGDDDEDAGMDMEFTGAVGGILSPILEERTGSQDGHTAGMDITAAVGRILPPGLGTSDRAQAKQLMELESDAGQLASSPFQDQARQSPPKLAPSHHVASVASETGSPSLASVRSRRTRRESASSAANFSPIGRISPNKPRTPTQHLTPQPTRPTTPGKTPPSSNITFRSASPRKLFKEEIKASATKSRTPERRSLFEDSANGDSTPAFILRPHPRYSSGLGIDKEGLGSPKVADILDRRRSIGEDAQEFIPQESPPRRLRFEDPVKLHEEVDREREEEENREGGTPVLQASDPDATSNLRDLISSLTPKKRKVGSRKSLHVGAARGLLGKRPIELDDEEEEEESPKRIRAANASPVKPVKLPAPPTKEETVRRVARFSLSPGKQASFTPRGQPPRPQSPVKFKSPAKTLDRRENAEEYLMEGDESQENVEDEADWEPIQLQDFLNLTNIHFMELTTTKRRHTTVAANDKSMDVTGSREVERTNITFEDCVAAGFCTVPMLELYQHVSLHSNRRILMATFTDCLVLSRVEIIHF
jgi:kinetochore protein Spc7/SPC105